MLWDNFAVTHSATPIEYSDQPGRRRILDRISTKGRPPIQPLDWPVAQARAPALAQ
jgi:hypothetical protein